MEEIYSRPLLFGVVIDLEKRRVLFMEEIYSRPLLFGVVIDLM
ncbi:hypothetical protein [Staphylococcus pseudintermedius]